MTKKYKPVDYSDEDAILGVEVSCIQAAQALDLAAQMAVEKNEPDTLLAVASLWITFGEKLLESGKPEISNKEEEEKRSMGFNNLTIPDEEDEGRVITNG